jgi:hypothetical protein
MKRREHRKSIEPFNQENEPFPYEGSTEDVVGTKQLYNWLYQKEEEDYYLSQKASGALPGISYEALFVEC